MGEHYRCAVWGYDNDHQYSDHYVIKPHISKWDQSLQMHFFSLKNENEVKNWTKLVNRVFGDSLEERKHSKWPNTPRFVQIILNMADQ